MKTIHSIFLLTCLVMVAVSCKKDPQTNPYDNWQSNDVLYVGEDDIVADETSLAGIHKTIFAVNCANSGCHDGHFEPDFRTIESSYSTLINRTVIKSDPDNPLFTLRVVPGKSSESMLMHRMKHNILNNSGLMPLSIDPTSDWLVKKEDYLARIAKWIDDGAADILGNKPTDADMQPQLQGLIAFADGSPTPITRLSKYGAIPVPPGTNSLKLMVAYSDDKTNPNNFSVNKLNHSLSPLLYSSADEKTMTNQSVYNADGLFGPTGYYHTITLNVASLGNPGDVIWLKTYVNDNVNPTTEIPSASSLFHYKTYFALLLQ